MKRNKWLLSLIIALAALISGSALAAGSVNIASNEYISETYSDYITRGCVLGDTLYLSGRSHLFTYHIGEDEVAALDYEEPEAEEDEFRDFVQLFSDGESLYMLSSIMYSDEESYFLDRLEILPIELDGQSARFGEPVEADVSELTVDYGDDNEYLVQINDACCVNGTLLMSVYDSSYQPAVYAMDIESGDGYYIDDLEQPMGITPYEDGQVLISTYDYSDRTFTFYLYDVEEEELSPAREPIAFDEDKFEYFGGMAYSAESGRLFYLSGGYLMAMKDFDYENAEPVAELSLLYSGEGQGGLLLPGDYYVYISHESTYIRSTDPEALPDVRLIVQNNGMGDSVMNAYNDFFSAHPDVAVVLNSNYISPESMVEGMMNRDDSVDIYMLSVSSESYEAVFNRGFMAELTSETLTSAIREMYPAIQEVLMRDGKAVGIPVSVYSWMPGFDYEGWEKLGYAREDVPKSWKEFLEMLPELAKGLPEDGSVILFPEYETQEAARMEMIDAIMEAWRMHLSATGQEPRYDDPQFAELLNLAMTMDYGALGLPEGNDEEGYVYSVSASGDRIHELFTFSTGCSLGNFYNTYVEPALLEVVPGEGAEIPLSITVAFVNPFSKHVDLAQEFLETLLGDLDDQVTYNLSDKRNEPVRSPYMLEYIEETKETLEDVKAQLETADPVDVPSLEENIQSLEQSIADMEENSWSISPESIEWFRAHDDLLAVQRCDYINAADDDGEISDMAQQMLDGRMKVEDFLKELDRRVRMRAMEGN